MAATRDWNIDCKVYVGEIGYGAAKQDLEELFSKYGPLKNVWVARNPPGFAFVEFEDPMDAQDAADALDGSRINGRRARVEMSSGKSRWGRGGPPMRRGGGGGGGGGGGYRGGRDSYRSRGRSRSRSPRRRSPSPSTRRRTPSPRRGRYSRSRSPRQSREKSPRRDRSPRTKSPRDRSLSPVGGGNRDRSPDRE